MRSLFQAVAAQSRGLPNYSAVAAQSRGRSENPSVPSLVAELSLRLGLVQMAASAADPSLVAGLRGLHAAPSDIDGRGILPRSVGPARTTRSTWRFVLRQIPLRFAGSAPSGERREKWEYVVDMLGQFDSVLAVDLPILPELPDFGALGSSPGAAPNSRLLLTASGLLRASLRSALARPAAAEAHVGRPDEILITGSTSPVMFLDPT